MKSSFHVVTVGGQGRLDAPHGMDAVHGASHLGRDCIITRVSDCSGLAVIPATEACDVVVLEESLSQKEVIDTAQFIRQRWSGATIVVVSASPLDIDPSLYDDCVLPSQRLQQTKLRKVWEC